MRKGVKAIFLKHNLALLYSKASLRLFMEIHKQDCNNKLLIK